MKITRKREIILQRERSVTIKFNGNSSEALCFGCEENVRFVTIDEAALVLQTNVRAVFRLVQAGRVHFSETATGSLLICFKSLSNAGNEIDLIESEKQK